MESLAASKHLAIEIIGEALALGLQALLHLALRLQAPDEVKLLPR